MSFHHAYAGGGWPRPVYASAHGLCHARLPPRYCRCVPWSEIMALGRVNLGGRPGTILHDRSGLEKFPAPRMASANRTAKSAARCGSRSTQTRRWTRSQFAASPTAFICSAGRSGTVRQFWRKKLTGDGHGSDQDVAREASGHDWAAAVHSPEFWEKMARSGFLFPDEELWALRYKLRRELVEFARRRLLLQNSRVTQGDFIRYDHLLNPDALTIGFGAALLPPCQTRAADLPAV